MEDPHIPVAVWFIYLFQPQALCPPSPTHLLETLQQDGSAEAMQAPSEGPGDSFSETETQSTVKGSLELGLSVLREEDLLRVQIVNLQKKTSVSFFLALHKHQLNLKLGLIFFSWY